MSVFRQKEAKKRYSVQEVFFSLQGEGRHSGRAAFFIRLMGCDQSCVFCDSARTWKKELLSPYERYTGGELAALVPAGAAFVVVTGGEPALWDLEPLTSAIKAAHPHLPIHIETAGHRPLSGSIDYVTVSPKAIPPLKENVMRADELKIIVTKRGDIESHLSVLVHRADNTPIYLHIEWSQRDNTDLLAYIVEYIKTHGDPFRAGLQIHKYLRADALDPRSKE